MTRLLATFTIALHTLAACADGPSTAVTTSAQVRTWVKQLDDDSFRARAAAEKALKKAGRPAVAELAKVVEHESVEVRNRTERILQHIVKNADFETQNEAAVVLGRILGKDVVTSLRAKWAHEWLSEKKIKVNAAVATRGEATAIVLDSVVLSDVDANRTATSIELLATNIVSLSVFKSKISPAAMNRIGNMPTVRFVSLRGENVSDETLANIKSMTSLERLSLQNTSVTDAGLAHLKPFKRLKIVDLTGSQITDEGIKSLAQIHSLETLLVNDTSLSDVGVARLADMPRLTQVRANRTKINDAALREFAKIPRLRTLWIKGTHVSDEALAEFRKQRPDCLVYK